MAEIEGTVTLDSVAAEVSVLALSAEKVEGEYQILDSTVSASDGAYGLDPGSNSIVIAIGGNGSAQGAVAAGALWTPAEITTALWLDAADASTITESGGAVSAWDDKSGNARYAGQATSANQPLIQSAVQNGLDVLRFDGANDFLHIAHVFANAAASQQTVFAVVDKNGGTANGVVASVRPNSAASEGWVLRLGAHIEYFHTGFTISPLYPYPAGFMICQLMRDGLSVQLGESGNLGSTNVLTGYGASTVTRAIIGAEKDGAANFLNGDIGEIIIVDGAPDTATRQLIEGYLAWKWGLEANLPSGHPYKSAAPTV